MECNKEEATRAKEIAEKKMESRDFFGARKVGLMAQRLYPDLKDISQMILVCDVHCAAQNKVYGGEKDWYGILQVEPTVDEVAIKKQYRKLALLLHPDKNQFAGASDAFKYIGEAQKVLVNKEMRAVYDRKRKASGRVQVSNRATHQGSKQSNVRSHPWFQKSVMTNSGPKFMNQQSQQPKLQTQPVPETSRATFWTVCPFCSVRYQYYKEVVNRTLHCQNCKKEFIGYEIDSYAGTTEVSSSQPKFSQEHGTVSHGHSVPVKLSTSTGFSSKTPDQGSLNPENLQRDPCLEVNKEPIQNNNCQNGNVESGNDRKTRNKPAKSMESFMNENATENGEDMIIEEDCDNQQGQNSGYDTDKNLQRSAWFKQHVSFDENLGGNGELLRPPKRPKSSEFVNPGAVHLEKDNVQHQAGLAADMGKKEKETSSFEGNLKTKLEGCVNFSLFGDVKTSCDPEFFEYPDPDFNDFDQLRRVGDFSPGQLWAVYDNLDGMPRFYALIKKVMSPGFKLRITWLEPDPDDEVKIKWVSVGLPTSCGKFKLGNTEDNEDHGMFSHLTDWGRPNRKDIYTIYPRKGEIWAIFKDWDLNWYSTLSDKKYYEFEFVEVLSDYADEIGVQVAYVAKIKGFTCLFCRATKAGKGFDVIPAEHIFKFSHKVPSFQMTGKEGKNVPAGSFELDPASLPINHDRIEVLQNLNSDTGESMLNGSSSRSAPDILKVNHDLKQDESRTLFVELKEKSASDASMPGLVQLEAKSRGKGCLTHELRSEGNASLADSTEVNAEHPGNGYLPQVTKAVKVSEKADLKFKVEGNSFDAAERLDCHDSSGIVADSFTEDIISSQAATSEGHTVPDPEFYNFDADKRCEKFKVGQIWAIYCDEDTLPKYYCIIKRIDSPPHFALHVAWLAACSPSKDIMRWTDKKMPISCGNFKLGRKKAQKYENTSAFSHEVKVQPTNEKNNFVILPQAGDVWALYKGWSENLTHADLMQCKYEIVEVLEKNEKSIKVLVLEQVSGFKSVFGPQTRGNVRVTILIPWVELRRFSHQVPAVRLSEEKEGSLRGFWETDAAALPAYFFSSN